MNIFVSPTMEELGKKAAQTIASLLQEAIDKKGYARLVLSTGASQFSTIEALVSMPLDWSKVTMFHLDEYVGLPISHKASFRSYLQARFVDKVPNLKEAVFVDGEKDTACEIARLTERLREDEIDVGVIGIGENAHIAFNDPPANFATKDAYIVVDLDTKCKNQQVGEGWFATVDDVPKQAISMTCYQIMQCKTVVSPVPNAVKAQAIYDMLSASETTNIVPATLLKEHADFRLFIDENSAQKCTKEMLQK